MKCVQIVLSSVLTEGFVSAPFEWLRERLGPFTAAFDAVTRPIRV